MKIAFDPQIFMMQEYGGVSRYFCSLVSALSSHHDVEAKIFAPLHINSYLSGLPPKLVSGQRIRLIPKTGRLCIAINQVLVRPVMRRFHPDIVHATYFSPNSYAPKSARRVVTVYDMIHERFSGMFSKRDRTSEWKRQVTQRADHVICISENTRKDLLELTGLPPEKVSVAYLGFDALIPDNTAVDASSRPFMLYVGHRYGYKNFDTFIRAYASSPWLCNNYDVVCFGGGAFTKDEANLFVELGLAAEKVVQRRGSDAKLAAYYRDAAVFVYPSLYEGFGIPLLEAMSLNCPVVCANTSSIPEVAGGAAEYFDPRDMNSIRSAIELVLNSSEKSAYMIREGQLRCAQFSWERCAEKTLAIYRGLVE